ncbi:MAG: hypothetical protein NTX17_02470 [Candidatus Eisenbacteria bacterium]|nr:hypothetical protein [Candidatus Eisenbacteria bacterium]
MGSIQRVGGFDIGTNSVRILVADIDSFSRVVASFRLGFAVRLGEGLSSTGRVSEVALERTCRVLGKSTLLARRLGTSRILTGATHALRVAANSADVVGALEEAGGLPINVLTPEEEAYYVYTGALSDSFSYKSPSAMAGRASEVGGAAGGSFSLRREDRAEEVSGCGFVIDVGGGSTALIKGTDTGTIRSSTLPLGCVTLTEEFLKHDPPTPDELQALEDHVVTELSKARPSVLPEAEDCVTGVGGAATSIAAISLGLPYYDSRRVEGHILAGEEIERCAQRLSKLTLEEREEIEALGSGRAEIAVAGAFVLSLVARHLNVKRLTISTRGLRYGLALEAAAHPAG